MDDLSLPKCPCCELPLVLCADSCSGPRPLVDLTTAGANVDTVTYHTDPRVIESPPMPEGEPDYHEMVRMVRQLQTQIKQLFLWQVEMSRELICPRT